ncbi:pi/alpha-stichotoxin-Hmg5b-like [Tubulanus polymorphus]
MYKTLFIALALFMVIGAFAAEEIEVEKRGIPCSCHGKPATYWLLGPPSHICCPLFIGRCCLN